LYVKLHDDDKRKIENISLRRSMPYFGRYSQTALTTSVPNLIERARLSTALHLFVPKKSIDIRAPLKSTDIRAPLKSTHIRAPLKSTDIPRNSETGRCKVKIPDLFEIDYNNIYWQRFVSSNGTYFLYNAFYDDRQLGGPLPVVRIIAMIDRLSPPPILCQLWFANVHSPVVTLAAHFYMWYPQWGNYNDGILQPYLITCPISQMKEFSTATHVPRSVSLIKKPCENATNSLLIINNRSSLGKKQFAVCVKGLDFPTTDLSARLVEWIELLNILGVDKIFFYEYDLDPNTTKVLKYYHDRQLIQVKKMSLPGSQPNLPELRHQYLKNQTVGRRHNEIISYNDCLYNNIYSYQYLVLLDIDEVIMPLVHGNWSQLIAKVQEFLRIKKLSRAAYSVQNVYFFDDFNNDNQIKSSTDNAGDEIKIPPYLHMLQHVYRSHKYNIPGYYEKSFFDTERVVTMHNHYPFSCFGSCTVHTINTSLAHLQHYRRDCAIGLSKVCQNEYRALSVRDTTIWRYKRELMQRTSHTLTQLGLLIP
jgi:hypothetical protein